MLLYGIAPVFKAKLKLLINSSAFFSVSFDESLNRHVQKCQMDTNLRYWNKEKSIVETCYLYSQFLLRRNAQNLFEAIIASIAGLDESNLIQLIMNGPTVHWNVLELLDDYLLEKGDKKSFNLDLVLNI